MTHYYRNAFWNSVKIVGTYINVCHIKCYSPWVNIIIFFFAMGLSLVNIVLNKIIHMLFSLKCLGLMMYARLLLSSYKHVPKQFSFGELLSVMVLFIFIIIASDQTVFRSRPHRRDYCNRFKRFGQNHMACGCGSRPWIWNIRGWCGSWDGWCWWRHKIWSQIFRCEWKGASCDG